MTEDTKPAHGLDAAVVRLVAFVFAAIIVGVSFIALDFFGAIDALASVLVVALAHTAFNWRDASGTVKAAGKKKRFSGTVASAQAELPILRFVFDQQTRSVEILKGLGKGLAFLALRFAMEHGLDGLLVQVPIGGRDIYVVLVILGLAGAIFMVMPTSVRLLKPLFATRPNQDDAEESEIAGTTPATAPAPSLAKDSLS